MGQLIRALRLPFLSASVLPFIFGSLISRDHFVWLPFLCGLLAAAATHISANLINDYADSRSGNDWQDQQFYRFFGGSKLIQEGVFTEQFYLKLALMFALLSCVSVAVLAFLMQSVFVIGFFCLVIGFSWAYSQPPLKLSYRRWGEVVIFFLFGPALVMGGYYIQTGLFPDGKSFLLSLPFGFLTTAILFANEVPDYPEDQKVGKFTWVSLTTPRQAYLLYGALIAAAFMVIGIAMRQHYLNGFAAICLLFIPIAVNAASTLNGGYDDKLRLVRSSQLTIMLQTGVSMILILAAF